MSSRLARRFVLAGLLVGAGLSARLAYADAASLQAMVGAALTPSVAPALLGPITEAGRKGWKCLPERAAAARQAMAADLPSANDQP